MTASPPFSPTVGDAVVNRELERKYDAVAYAAQSNALSHPGHLATVATLFGLAPPEVATCRVLEVGCSDGANLLPMAAALPHAQFVGCDLSGSAIADARRAAQELGLANVTFLQQDLATLTDDPGTFDYIIAHGVYSWVPAPVRDALLALAARRLARNGALFVSYNVYPGCHVREAAWQILHYHVDRIADPRGQLDAARAFAALLAEPGVTQTETDALLRQEFRRLATQTDSALLSRRSGAAQRSRVFPRVRRASRAARPHVPRGSETVDDDRRGPGPAHAGVRRRHGSARARAISRLRANAPLSPIGRLSRRRRRRRRRCGARDRDACRGVDGAGPRRRRGQGLRRRNGRSRRQRARRAQAAAVVGGRGAAHRGVRGSRRVATRTCAGRHCGSAAPARAAGRGVLRGNGRPLRASAGAGGDRRRAPGGEPRRTLAGAPAAERHQSAPRDAAHRRSVGARATGVARWHAHARRARHGARRASAGGRARERGRAGRHVPVAFRAARIPGGARSSTR